MILFGYNEIEWMEEWPIIGHEEYFFLNFPDLHICSHSEKGNLMVGTRSSNALHERTQRMLFTSIY